MKKELLETIIGLEETIEDLDNADGYWDTGIDVFRRFGKDGAPADEFRNPEIATEFLREAIRLLQRKYNKEACALASNLIKSELDKVRRKLNGEEVEVTND